MGPSLWSRRFSVPTFAGIRFHVRRRRVARGCDALGSGHGKAKGQSGSCKPDGGKEAKVARAFQWTGLGIAVGLIIQPNALRATTPTALVGLAGAVAQTPVRPSRIHNALSSGISSYQRGDYETASLSFQEAQAGKSDLSTQEQEELDSYIRRNSEALKARRDGLQQLQQAELAMSSGKTAEAESLLKAVSTNQFLSSADQLKAHRLAEQLRAGGMIRRSSYSSGGVSPNVLARTKLQQARLLLSKANFDAAEALAREADQLNVSYGPGEDTPKRVFDDISRVKNDTKGLLSAGRQALQGGDLDRAEALAHAAERASTGWSWRLFGDSPTKLLRDIQSARRHSGQDPKMTGDSQPTPISTSEAARTLLKQGRLALQRGDLNQARDYANQAQELHVDFHWWEDTPTKLNNDIGRAAKRNAGKEGKKDNTSYMGSESSDSLTGDPHMLLLQARSLMMAGKLDDAAKMAAQLHNNAKVNWGLFGDSPEKLAADIQLARTKAKNDQAAMALAEAKELLKQGKFEAARAAANRAERLHGPYSAWDMNERPSKLLAEISRAEQQKKSTLAAAPPAPPPMPAVRNGALADAGSAKQPGTAQTKSSAIVLASATEEVRPSEQPSMPQIINGNTAGPKDLSKQRAMLLLAEAKSLQASGRLVDARQKALEAQRAGASFTANEDTPEQVLLRLAALATKRVEQLVQEATDYAVTAHIDSTRFQKAEDDLEAARRIAQGFSLDTQAIDAKAAWVRRSRMDTARNAPSSAVLPPTTPSAPIIQKTMPETMPVAAHKNGPELLQKARVELSRGDLDTARRLAIEVYNGPYGMQPDADKILHAIDAEDQHQRARSTDRSFDAGLAAYYRKDYGQAAMILHALDATLLSKEKQAQLKELMMVPELQTKALTQTVATSPPPSGTEPGRITVSDAADQLNPPAQDKHIDLKDVQAMQEIEFQKWRDQGLRAQKDATERFRAGEADQALELLNQYLDSLKDCRLDADHVALLQRSVEARLQQLKTLRAQQSYAKQQSGERNAFSEMMSREAKIEDHKQKQILELMKEYRDLSKEGKYKEALVRAEQAHELNPDSADLAAAVEITKTRINQLTYDEIKARKEERFISGMDEAEDPGAPVTSKEPLAIDKERLANAKMRKPFPKEGLPFTIKTEKQREIEHKLGEPATFDFKDTPLRQVLDDLRDWTQLNIVVDQPALDDEGISLDRPINVRLDGVSIKTALDIVLQQAHLIWVPRDEVILITTETHARGKLVQVTYQVADLVIPIDNQTLPNTEGMDQMAPPPGFLRGPSGNTPGPGPGRLPFGTPVGTPSQLTTTEKPTVTNNNRAQTIEDELIKLITKAIKPESWSEMGGPGTIEYYPLGMALVVSQTPDIQEQIADLLAALRRLQDIEITIEVRFITLREQFFERMGLDFAANILTDNAKFAPIIQANRGTVFGFQPKSFVSGLAFPPGAPVTTDSIPFTPDLNIPIAPTSFGASLPPFGSGGGGPFTDGGLSLGLAFLSDIQVFLFLDAAQGDSRSNIMTAPKITLFNGQTSTISVTNTQFFVTNVNAVQTAEGSVVFIPTNTAFVSGLTLALNGVVSADRRFVRLSIAPTLRNVSGSQLFPITTFITPTILGGALGQPVPFTQFLQSPITDTIAVATSVNVPDGGTVVLGGLKAMNEERNELGPPILSKIPFINRLFKNVGYGRESSNLMMMVTPRIIIQEEEETRQTGVGAVPGAGTPAP
jgi:type II secretory pathway component GspD/PulD (secretin)/tetratricopeptide (TPR) repeat protein